jgi:hypothetical protein
MMGHTGSPETLVPDQILTPGKNPKTVIQHACSIHNLKSSPNIFSAIRSIKCIGHAAQMEEIRKLYQISVGKPKGEKPL